MLDTQTESEREGLIPEEYSYPVDTTYPPTIYQRLEEFVTRAADLIILTEAYGEHGDPNGCNGTCPKCYLQRMELPKMIDQAKADVRSISPPPFVSEPPNATAEFYVAIPEKVGYRHAWYPFQKKTACGHWANPGWTLRPGRREEVTCESCKRCRF